MGVKKSNILRLHYTQLVTSFSDVDITSRRLSVDLSSDWNICNEIIGQIVNSCKKTPYQAITKL
jgi:hypothetical protein